MLRAVAVQLPAASVSTTRLSAAISVVEPTAGVVTQVPIVDVAYVAMTVAAFARTALATTIYEDLQLGAVIDESGRYRAVIEVQAVVDAKAFQFSKALASEATPLSTVSVSLAKTPQDTQGFTDQLTMAVAKVLSELLEVPDQVALNLARVVVDVAPLQDLPAHTLEKFVADGVAMSDAFDTTDGSLYQFAKYVMNMAFTSDVLRRDVTKKLSDAPNVYERKAVQFTKAPIYDEFTQTDRPQLTPRLNKFDTLDGITDFSSKDVHKRITEVVTLLDAVERVLHSSAADTNVAVPTDLAAKGVAKALTDGSSVADAFQPIFGKKNLDTLTVADVISITLVFIRTYNDAISMADYSRRDVQKGLSDAPLMLDSAIAYLSKTFTDAFGLNDMADLGDGITFFFSHTVANVAFMADNLARQSQLRKFDTTLVADSGSLLAQGYCDLTYFAEDYVGEARSF